MPQASSASSGWARLVHGHHVSLPSRPQADEPARAAGKPGKCPKCGATFRVPIPEPDEPAAPSEAAPARASPWADQPVQAPATAPLAGQTAKPSSSPGVNGPPAATPGTGRLF